MKNLAILALLSSLIPHPSSLSAAGIPVPWTVDMRRAQPATFEAYQGETFDFQASLTLDGKPFEAPSNYSFFWQTNGMGNVYWSTNCNHTIEQSEQSNNVLRATWTPSMETGARAYNCFIGVPGTLYHAAFQLRLRPSPGATPNALPLPVPVIDFAKVRVLNPPWSGGGGSGVDTNAVRDIVRPMIADATNGIRSVDGAARPLPRYLHALDFADSYPDAAQEYYRSRGNGKADGGCSSVRSGGFLSRNFDFPFDDRAEFVVRMSAGPAIEQSNDPNNRTIRHRFASVGVAQVGTNLTEQFVTSGKHSRCYKWLPGATVDGINENGVACNINVVNGDPQTSGWHNDTGDLHPLAAIRWILDNATNAQHAATYIASHISFPQGWTQNYHYMIADESSTYIVENGGAWRYDTGLRSMTNFLLDPDDLPDFGGPGTERWYALEGSANITNVWYTNAYRRETNPPWVSDLAEVIDYTNAIFDAWASHPKEYFRNSSLIPHTSSLTWWQTVHTSVYDLTNRVLRVAVQEVDDWYVFQVPSSGAKVDAYTKAETDGLLEGKLDKTDVVSPLDTGITDNQAAGAKSTQDALYSLDTSVQTIISLDLPNKMDKSPSPADRKYAKFNGDFLVGSEYGDEEISVIADAVSGKFDTSRVSSTDPNFTNAVIETMKGVTPQPSPTLRIYDEVRQCWWIGKMVNGVMQWEVE